MLCTFDIQRSTITNLEGSGLLHAMVAGMGWALQCNRVASTSGSQKVTVFVVFHMPLGLGEVGTFKLSTRDVAAKLGTLNAMLPSLSKVM